MAPKQSAALTTVYAVIIPMTTVEGLAGSHLVGLYVQEEDAQEAVRQGMGAAVQPHGLHYGPAANTVTVKANTKASKTDNDAGDNGEAKKKSKKTSIPEGRADSLQGYVLMFSGTFERMDRTTCDATAVKFGATVSKKLDDVNCVVLGTKAGPKKLEEINSKGIKTMNESDFLGLIGAQFDSEPPTKKAKK